MSDALRLDLAPRLSTPAAFSAVGKPSVSLRHVPPAPGTMGRAGDPSVFAWDVVADGQIVGRVGLDFDAAEFEAVLAKYCPAVRIAIDRAHRGLGFATEALRQLMEELEACHFVRPLMAAHPTGDDALAHVLSGAGFIHTGCRSRGRDGREVRHMIKLL